MKKGIVLIASLIFGLILVGCELETEENFHFVALEVVEAEVPDNFTLNGLHPINVTYLRPDDCTFFEGFDIVQGENGLRNIAAIGSTLTDRECNQQIDSVQAVLTVNAVFNGTYTLRFYAGSGEDGSPEYIVYEVPVVDRED